jgi:hypothetical protein
MCRNIRTLHNFEPPATPDEVHAAAFDLAVEEVAATTGRMLAELTTTAPPKDRAVEADKARARAATRYA